MLQTSFTIDRAIFPPAAFGNLGALMTSIITLLIILAAVLCLIFVIIGGFKYVTSGGDEKKLASAQGTLTYALVGLIVIILAFALLQVVQYFLRSTVPIN